MKKDFDAVEFQRRVRAELSREYIADRKGFMRELERVRKRYRKARSS